MNAALNFFRCHGVGCPGKHKAKTFTSPSEERKKGWKRCDCPIVASGTLDRISKRVATKETDWASAAARMAPFIAANSWDITPPPVPPSSTPPPARPPEDAGSVSMETATQAYVTAHEDARSAASTVTGHRQKMALLVKFSERTGALCVNQWTGDLVRRYLSENDVAGTTAHKYAGNMIAFFNFCIAENWIKENPAKLPQKIRNRETRNATVSKQKIPFTDEELERMYAACKDYDRLAKGNRTWKGEDLGDFIAVSCFTGLRISDVATFHIDRLRGTDEIHVRTTKAGTMVYSAVPPWLAERIRTRAKQIGPFIFGSHTSTNLSVITCEWRKRLNKLWAASGPWKVRPTPHLFRHTFARILLQNGNHPATVAELLGNTEAVVREYYAAWVPERQERISRIVRESFADTPTPFTLRKPKIVEIKHG